MVNWNPDLLNRLLAPGIAEFRIAEIPDLTSEHKDTETWLASHFLHSALHLELPEHARQFAFNMIYRAQTCFNYYHQARTATLDFLADGAPHNPSIRRYFTALALWESAFLNWQVAVIAWRAFTKINVFERDDGSRDQRAYEIATEIKHCGERIADRTHAGDLTVPVWLTNDGFRTRTTALAYGEIGELLRELIRTTNEFVDPLALVEKYRDRA